MAFDPVSFAVPDEMRKLDFERPIMCINSEDFYRKQYPQFDNDRRLDSIFQSNKKLKDYNINIYLKNSNHIDCADLGLLLAGEFKLFKVIKSIKWCHKILDYHIELAVDFMKNMQVRSEEGRDHGRTIIHRFKNKHPQSLFYFKDIEHLL
jgi:hypothetical protein